MPTAQVTSEEMQQSMVQEHARFRQWGVGAVEDTDDGDPDSLGYTMASNGDAVAMAGSGTQRATPAELSQLPLVASDACSDAVRERILPQGKLDVNEQQIDLRTSNSWLLKMHEVSTPELVETFAINTLAPFVLNARLQDLLLKGRSVRGEHEGGTA